LEAKSRSEEHEHHIRLKLQDEFARQNEVQKLSGCDRVNDADIWDESAIILPREVSQTSGSE
jgi:predicted TIM-barrel fold metal-dependent hydrolase